MNISMYNSISIDIHKNVHRPGLVIFVVQSTTSSLYLNNKQYSIKQSGQNKCLLDITLEFMSITSRNFSLIKASVTGRATKFRRDIRSCVNFSRTVFDKK